LIPSLAIAAALAPVSARAQIAVIGGTVEERTAVPGETYIGTLIVQNLTKTPQPARIYQTDYSFFADGTSHFDVPGSVQRSNARWITPSTGTVIVPPKGEVTVAYTVRVPAADSLRGTYWSAIMVEGAVSNPRDARGRTVSLGSVMRYAVQIATHIERGANGRISFENQRTGTGSDSSRSLELDVLNTGERGYRPLMWVELYNSHGELSGKFEQQRGLLYPGTSLTQKFELGRLAPGSYKAVVFADTDDDAVFAAEYKLHF
jgi:hypothetical protein